MKYKKFAAIIVSFLCHNINGRNRANSTFLKPKSTFESELLFGFFEEGFESSQLISFSEQTRDAIRFNRGFLVVS